MTFREKLMQEHPEINIDKAVFLTVRACMDVKRNGIACTRIFPAQNAGAGKYRRKEVKEMNKEQWSEVAREIVPHLEKIRQIALKHEIKLNMSAGFGGDSANAFVIENDVIYDLDYVNGKYKTRLNKDEKSLKYVDVTFETEKALTPASK